VAAAVVSGTRVSRSIRADVATVRKMDGIRRGRAAPKIPRRIVASIHPRQEAASERPRKTTCHHGWRAR
jgi:hypothetical protein